MNLTLLRYANYKNRIVRTPLQNVQDYVDIYGATILTELMGVINWNPNDGISATQVFDYTGATPDYCLVSNDYGEIESRWYVMEARRTRHGQYQVGLLRDVIADYYNEVLDATYFVEKATPRLGDPALYNEEMLNTNQILTRKDLLYDETGCPWIVGYIPKSFPEDEDAQPTSITLDFEFFPEPDYEVTHIEDFQGYSSLNKSYLAPGQTFRAETFYTVNGGTARARRGITLELTENSVTATGPTNANSWEDLTISLPAYYGNGDFAAQGVSYGAIINLREQITKEIGKLNTANIYNYFLHFQPYELSNATLESLVNKTIRETSTNTYYKVVKETSEVFYEAECTSISGQLWNSLRGVFNAKADNFLYLTANSCFIRGPLTLERYSLKSVGASGTTTITHNRSTLEDQPYDMFCMPYSDDLYLGIDGYPAVKFSKAVAMGVAQQLASKIGSAAVYDIQIVPYSPVSRLLATGPNGEKMITYKQIAATDITTKPNEQGLSTIIGAMFWCSSSQFSFEIPYYIDLPSNSISTKIMSICDKYRLCSPNMASFFDFDPVKNKGVSAIEVDCYYKPYNPYIHLNPKFGGIYGGSTGWEVRGLDLAGNFSLTQISSAWADYQLQNKNFQNVFDRQQANLTKMRGYERAEQIVSGVVGAAGAGVQTGLMTGNVGLGLIAGGVSTVGGVADIFHLEGKYKEVLDYNKTMHEYSLENIQALPESLTRVDALSPNNPIIPYIEYYTSTEIEKNAIRNNLIYGGMTIGRIGSLRDFVYENPTFMKGQLIRIEGLQEDYHFADTISQELKLGVFI